MLKYRKLSDYEHISRSQKRVAREKEREISHLEIIAMKRVAFFPPQLLRASLVCARMFDPSTERM